MIVFDCAVCSTRLSAQPGQAGAWVLCPNCRTKLQVPIPQAAVAVADKLSMGPAAASVAAPTGAKAQTSQQAVAKPASQSKALAFAPVKPAPKPIKSSVVAPTRSFGKLYGFNCSYCSSRLEATESMAAQDGQCPTCGNTITIPIKDRFGRLIDPRTKEVIKQDPHPVHAYAAAGERAPTIIRQGDGKQSIRCGKCSALSPITSNNCKACGMPFTMEGTTVEASGASNGFAVASLVLGIIGLPACNTLVPCILAIVFGSIGLYQVNKNGDGQGGWKMAAMGMALGSIGIMCWAYFYFR